MFYFFARGDPIPQWIEYTSNMNMYFAFAVMVHRLPDVVHVFPLEPMDQRLIIAKKIDINEWSYMIRQNVIIHKEFREFFDYEDEP